MKVIHYREAGAAPVLLPGEKARVVEEACLKEGDEAILPAEEMTGHLYEVFFKGWFVHIFVPC